MGYIIILIMSDEEEFRMKIPWQINEKFTPLNKDFPVIPNHLPLPPG